MQLVPTELRARQERALMSGTRYGYGGWFLTRPSFSAGHWWHVCRRPRLTDVTCFWSAAVQQHEEECAVGG